MLTWLSEGLDPPAITTLEEVLSPSLDDNEAGEIAKSESYDARSEDEVESTKNMFWSVNFTEFAVVRTRLVTLEREREFPILMPLGERKTSEPVFEIEIGAFKLVVSLRIEANIVPLVGVPSKVTEVIPLSTFALKKSKRWNVFWPAVTPPVIMQLPVRHVPPVWPFIAVPSEVVAPLVA